MDDKRLIELFWNRDETAIKETENKYGRLCHQIAYNILGDDMDSEECTNDTYLALWNKIPPEKPKNFKAFVCKIARNLSLKRFEYNTADKRNSSYTISIDELAEVLPDSSLKYDIGEADLGALINKFLYAESEDARNIFIRRYYFYDEITEIALRYSFSVSKVKSALFHTRSRLRKFLEEEGVYI